MRRGDIYYVEIFESTGHEMRKNRPCVIVSNNDFLDNLDVVQVVMCSSSRQHEIATHVPITSTPRHSVAMCEHLYTVDRSRLRGHLGRVTVEEMERINSALTFALGISERTSDCYASEKLQAELEFYRSMYAQMPNLIFRKGASK